MKILLIAGGWSSERDVSLKSAQNIELALKSLGHAVTFFDPEKNFNDLLCAASRHDFAFISLHGSPGEDGLIQAMLDAIHIPYQGSGPAGSFLALNKAASKQVFRHAGLKTADWEFLAQPPQAGWKPKMPFPVFVKSNTGGSSLRLGSASGMDELRKALEEIFDAGEEAIIEPLIRGREITCAILGDKPLPPILIEPLAGEFFDYESKYATGGAREICPAPITAAQTEEVGNLALKAHKALGLYEYSRSDFILNENGEFVILETNTLPGMTQTSLLPQAAAQAGMDFEQLLSYLIEHAINRFA